MVYDPFLSVILCDFNGKLSFLYKYNITRYEGCKVDDVTSQFGLQ